VVGRRHDRHRQRHDSERKNLIEVI
jgi:hypothetical protein